MEKFVVVLSQGDAREFESTANGQKEMVDVVDLVLTDGLNTFACSAFVKVAQRLRKEPLRKGAMINANLSFFARKAKNKDGGEFMQQACTLQDYGVIG